MNSETKHPKSCYNYINDGVVYAGPLAWRVKGDVRQIDTVTIQPGTVKLCADLFRNGTALQQVTLPDSLTEIDDRAFQNCRKLHDITIPPGVVRIGERAFDECTKLTVELNSMDVTIGRHCFMDQAKVHTSHVHPSKLPNNIRDSAILAFAQDCSNDIALDAVFHSQMMQYITNRRQQYYPLALAHWELMQTLIQGNIIPLEDADALLDTILQQGDADHVAAMMTYKQSLTAQAEDTLAWDDDPWGDLTLDWDIDTTEKTDAQLEKEWGTKRLPDGSYGLMRYYGEDIEITIPTKIGDKHITAIGPYACSPKRYGIKRERAEHLCQIRTVTIPEGIIRIGNNAFQGCTALWEVTIPQSIEYIGRDAFVDCKWKPY